VRLLIENDLAVYSSHLPLDAHPRLGNNAAVARPGVAELKPFFFCERTVLGFRANGRIARTDLGRRLGQAVGGA